MNNQNRSDITITLVSGIYLPCTGGIAIFTYNLATELSKIGYKVNIVTCDTAHIGFHVQQSRLNIYRLKSLKLFYGRFPLPYSLLEFIKVYRQCFSQENTRVLTNTRFYLTSLLAACMTSISKNKLFVIEHGAEHLRVENRYINFIIRIYEHCITKALRFFHPNFLAVSSASAHWLKHFGINQAGIVHNGVLAQQKYLNSPTKNSDRSAKNAIIYIGRIIKEKGVYDLLAAFSKFQKKFDYFSLTIIGGGEDATKVKKISMTIPNCRFLGEQTHEEVMRNLVHASVLVHPSTFIEGLPTVLLEAGIAKVPVISTHLGGASDLIISGKTALIIQPNSPNTILEALEYFVYHKDKVMDMTEAMHQLVLHKYTWETITKKFADMYLN